MKQYHIKKVINDIQWDDVKSLEINEFPWYNNGLKQKTFVQVARKKEALHIKVKAEDIHSSANVLEDNGSVYLDSCFEFFLTPFEHLSDLYINFEINCVGVLYLAVRNKNGKRRATFEELEEVKIVTSLPKKTLKKPAENDSCWYLDVEIPLSLIENLMGDTISFNKWYGNFYRCGGSIDDQYASWNSIVTDKPDFHQPKQFGELIF